MAGGLLAATAMARGLILVTRNVADLARSDVRVLNPFGPPRRTTDPIPLPLPVSAGQRPDRQEAVRPF